MKNLAKSSRLIEVFASAALFLIIIFALSSSFISMNKRNKLVNLLASSDKCVLEIEEAVDRAIQNADNSDSSVYAIERVNNTSRVIDLKKAPGRKGQYSGLISISKDIGPLYKADVILKYAKENRHILGFARITLSPDEKIKDGDLLEKYFDRESFKPISSCSLRSQPEIISPFEISLHEKKSLGQGFYAFKLSDFVIYDKNYPVFSRLFYTGEKIYE